MEKVTLNGKEQKRLLVMNELVVGLLAGQQAAEVLGVTLRHARRLLAAYRREGAAALVHGDRGREARVHGLQREAAAPTNSNSSVCGKAGQSLGTSARGLGV